jgi:YteA family regulatory protein
MLSTNQLDTLNKKLEKEKQEIKRQMNINHKYNNMGEILRETVDELSAYDNHPADLASELVDRQREVALEEHRVQELEKINTALEAIENGDYGKCQVCAEEIPFERLEALPTALYCVNHSLETAGGDDRPVEEDLLEPAEVNTFRHNSRDGIVDTEDSFEEVARFGTSETPSDLVGDYDSFNELYNKGKNEESYTEDYETYSATDITGKQKNVLPSRKLEEYQELLDRKGMDSKIGDIPYKKGDSYLEDKNN